MTLEEWKASGTYYNFKDCQVFYRKEGEGPIVFLLHAFPTSSWDWHQVWGSLSENFQLIAIDYPGFGFSDKPIDFSYTIHTYADLIIALANHLGIKQFHIIGQSFSVTVVQELMHRQNQGQLNIKLSSVCLLNGAIFMEKVKKIRILNMLKGPFGKWFCKYLFKKKHLTKNLAALFGHNSQPSNELLDQYWQLLRYKDGVYRLNSTTKFLNNRHLYAKTWSDAMIKTNIPIRLIWGIDDSDKYSGFSTAQYYNDKKESVDLVLFPDAGHYPHIEQPEKTAFYIETFLKSFNVEKIEEIDYAQEGAQV